MTDLRTAAQQALEALDIGYDSAKAEADQYHAAMAGYRPQLHAQMDAHVQQIAAAIIALKAALAEPVQEPVAKYSDIVSDGGFDPRNKYDTTPPRRKPLTEEEIYSLFRTVASPVMFARAVERAHGIV